jgi:hypothetical protein
MVQAPIGQPMNGQTGQPMTNDMVLQFSGFKDNTASDAFLPTNNQVTPCLTGRVMEIDCKISWKD